MMDVCYSMLLCCGCSMNEWSRTNLPLREMIKLILHLECWRYMVNSPQAHRSNVCVTCLLVLSHDPNSHEVVYKSEKCNNRKCNINANLHLEKPAYMTVKTSVKHCWSQIKNKWNKTENLHMADKKTKLEWCFFFTCHHEPKCLTFLLHSWLCHCIPKAPND